MTALAWAVKFPCAEGFRHSVVLYDGAKNLLLMAYLLQVRRVNPTPGAVAARFVFWYAFPRFLLTSSASTPCTGSPLAPARP